MKLKNFTNYITTHITNFTIKILKLTTNFNFTLIQQEKLEHRTPCLVKVRVLPYFQFFLYFYTFL